MNEPLWHVIQPQGKSIPKSNMYTSVPRANDRLHVRGQWAQGCEQYHTDCKACQGTGTVPESIQLASFGPCCDSLALPGELAALFPPARIYRRYPSPL